MMAEQTEKEDGFRRFEEYVGERQATGQKDGTVRFASMEAMIHAAKEIIDQYSEWEEKGLIFTGDPGKAFSFDAGSGQAVFQSGRGECVKNGSLVPNSIPVNAFTAPEFLTGRAVMYTPYAQRWSLAVALYEFFYHNGGPLKGAQSMRQVFFSEREEYIWMARHGVFNMEPSSANHPVHGVQDRLQKYWQIFPGSLREAFVRSFVEGRKVPERRLCARDWKRVMAKLECSYVECSCGYRGFVHRFRLSAGRQYICPGCGQMFYRFTNGMDFIYLSTNTVIPVRRIYPAREKDDSCLAMVVENTRQRGLYGIKNMSREIWEGKYPDGTRKKIVPGGGIPVWTGLELTFRDGRTWSIEEA